MIKITIPRRFAEDRMVARDLPMGDGRWVAAGYQTSMGEEDFADLVFDAEYHVEIGRFGWMAKRRGMTGVVASARATLVRCEKIMKEIA